jgi:hypothetical protein
VCGPAPEIDEHLSVCATNVAAAFGHRNIVGGTVVFTGPVNMAKNPTSLTGAQALHLRDLTG